MTALRHAARSSDICTSHEAAAFVVTSGIQKDQQAQAVAAVKRHPGMTSMQLSRAAGLDRYMLGRRLPELLKAELVWRGPNVPCPVSGRSACTWWPVAPGVNLELAV
ncbi:helix-turn-helix domain-containing protein [Stenotrophomonas sp.]|uniref:MarR family transcriptional regulator n=1 Tax=Stenotrophomonas sp. TaxID=69392 RepID=UPI0028A2D4B2|nr:helix-turn-helix domain-containing protein [Stenotrophomonas sp.]